MRVECVHFDFDVCGELALIVRGRGFSTRLISFWCVTILRISYVGVLKEQP